VGQQLAGGLKGLEAQRSHMSCACNHVVPCTDVAMHATPAHAKLADDMAWHDMTHEHVYEHDMT